MATSAACCRSMSAEICDVSVLMPRVRRCAQCGRGKGLRALDCTMRSCGDRLARGHAATCLRDALACNMAACRPQGKRTRPVGLAAMASASGADLPGQGAAMDAGGELGGGAVRLTVSVMTRDSAFSREQAQGVHVSEMCLQG